MATATQMPPADTPASEEPTGVRVSGYTVTYMEPAEGAPLALGVPVCPGPPPGPGTQPGVWMTAPAPGVGIMPGGPPPPPGAPAQLRSVDLPVGEYDGPVFLGATNGHGPIMFTCAGCGFSGLSAIRREKGFAYGMFAMMTFGIGLLMDGAKDTHHYCPRCNKHLAYAKLM